MKNKDNHINYVEFRATDLEKIKTFYNKAFGWTFTDYGESYTAFDGSGVQGGFEITKEKIVNGALVVLFHSDLNFIKNKVIDSGGKISLDIFSFPGGQRFQFFDPSGNELAVWSE